MSYLALTASFEYVMGLSNDHYTYIFSFSAGLDFRRQILTFKVESRAERVKIGYESDIYDDLDILLL